MGERGQTRRRFLQTSAGAATGLALAGFGLPAAASADPGDPLRELRLFAGDYVPVGWTRFGDGSGRALLGSGEAPGGPTRRVGAGGKALVRGGKDGDQPVTLGLFYILRDATNDGTPSPDAMVGEVRAFPFDTKIPNWAPCNGSDLPIGQYSALFSVIGLAFGGDGRQKFSLPDLRGRVPLGSGDAPGVPAVAVGERGDGVLTGGGGRRVRLHLNYRIATNGDYPNRPRG
jgi:hypothetical protein